MSNCPAYRYRVADIKTGEMLAEGTLSECAKTIGVHWNALWSTANGRTKNPKYQITLLPDEEDEDRPLSKTHLALARQWDAFIEPIRERYGVEVKK